MVRADQPMELRRREALPEVPGRIDAVGDAAPLKFEGIDFRARPSREGETEHAGSKVPGVGGMDGLNGDWAAGMKKSRSRSSSSSAAWATRRWPK